MPRTTERRRDADAAAALALLLATEKRTAAAVVASMGLAARHLAGTGQAPSVTEKAVRAVTIAALLRGRTAARDGAVHTLTLQTGLTVDEWGESEARAIAREDLKAARGSADRIAKRWRKAQAESAEADANALRSRTYADAVVDAEARANAETAWQVADAWNDEQLRRARVLSDVPGIAVTYRWNADGDDRTCDRCEDLNGTEVDDPDDFPEGWPPLHGNCRCLISTHVSVIENEDAA